MLPPHLMLPPGSDIHDVTATGMHRHVRRSRRETLTFGTWPHPATHHEPGPLPPDLAAPERQNFGRRLVSAWLKLWRPVRAPES